MDVEQILATENVLQILQLLRIGYAGGIFICVEMFICLWYIKVMVKHTNCNGCMGKYFPVGFIGSGRRSYGNERQNKFRN